MHAMNFDCSTSDYFAKANEEILVVLQTESPLGVKNAREIYSLPGVDAIFVGPVDLRAQMRSPDGKEASDAEFEAMLAEIVRIGKETGTPTGMHTMSPAAALERARQGMQFIAVGSELRMMAERASSILRELRPDAAQKEIVRY
jgi:4-hydroxy-2-oxoheptanedioate aldolase